MNPFRSLARRARPVMEQRAGYYTLAPDIGSASQWFPNTLAGTSVTEYSVLNVAAAWHCVNLIADSVAGFPLQAWRKDLKVEPTPPLLVQPNATQTRFETISQLVTSLVLRGNAYLLPFDFDANGYPRQVMVIHPDLVGVRRDQGQITYQIADNAGNVTILHPSEIVHIKGFCFPGALTGIGVVEAQRQGIGHSLALQDYGARFYSEGAVPTGVVMVEDAPLPEEVEAFKKQWLSSHSGRRTPAILSGGAKYAPISFTPEDSQFLESRQFALAEVALMFGVPGHFVGAPGSNMVYANVEQDVLNLVQFAFRRWMTRIEQALSALLPRGTDAKFNFDAFLRTDTKSRYEAHAIALSNGFMTVDEVRCLEGLPPMPEKPEPPTDMMLEGETQDTTDTTEGDNTNG